MPLIMVTPSDDVKYKHLILTMYLRGLLADNFQMKINVYFDDQGRRLLFSSATVNNSDIDRAGDFYCEQRFDFPTLQNLMTIGHSYYVEFELSGTYNYDNDNYLGLIIDHDSPLAILNDERNIIRQSSFFEVA